MSALTRTTTALGPALAVAAMATLLAAGLALVVGAGWPVVLWAAAVVLVVGTPFCLHLATVRVAVSAEAIGVASGWAGRMRWIPLSEVVEHEAVEVTWPNVYGVGLPFARRTTRLLVRAGPALRVRLVDGEQLWVSATDAGGFDEQLSDWTEALREQRSAS